jgi:hypothetical protein
MSQGSTHTDKVAAVKVARAAGGPGRLASLGDGAGQAAPMMLGQRIANDLIAAERALAEAENRYIGAKHGWADEMRRRGHGDGTEADVAHAQAALTAADEARRVAGEKIEELRLRLHNQRRREILAEAVSGQFIAHEAAQHELEKHDKHQKGKRKSLLARIFRR